MHIVDPKDYFEYTPGVPHLLAGSNAYKALLTPISRVTQGMASFETSTKAYYIHMI